MYGFLGILNGSNRTFMELKWWKTSRTWVVFLLRSNRTFMELKFHWNQDRADRWHVLIVPLWN